MELSSDEKCFRKTVMQGPLSEMRGADHRDRKASRCTSIAKWFVICIIFFALGAAIGFYGPLINNNVNLLLASGRSVSYEDQFMATHHVLTIYDFHEELCLNHSEADWGIHGNVIGGNDATIEDHPWQVSIQFKRATNSRHKFSHFCGGAIIAPQFILSAAHCFEGGFSDPKTWLSVHILAGSTNTNIPTDKLESLYGVQTARINTIDIHPKWNKHNFHYDFSLLMMDQKLIYRYGAHAVRPICMPKVNADFKMLDFIRIRPELDCKLAGWGITDVSQTFASPTLKEVELPWIPTTTCNSLFDKEKNVNIQEFMLCFGKKEGKVDACQGDSGGSISCKVDGVNLSLGVVSFGLGCAKPNKPGVYARTSYAADWAIKMMKTLTRLRDKKGFSVPAHWQSRAKCLKNAGKPSECGDKDKFNNSS